MSAIPSSHWLCKVRNQGFFLLADDMPHLIACDRLHQVLVRCNGCRMVVAAQDVEHVLAVVEASKLDYVRDVSLLAGDRLIAIAKSRVEVPVRKITRGDFDEAELGGAFDGFHVTSDADPGL